MDKVGALESIRQTWNEENMPLGEMIASISTNFYSAGLDLATTAAFIKATPSELDALLSLGKYGDDILDLLSELDPPKTTWALLASANDEEIEEAIKALKDSKMEIEAFSQPISEYVYHRMIEVSGPTKEQMIGNLSGSVIAHVLKKGSDFDVLNDWEMKFLKSIAAQKKKGKTLSDKQINRLIIIIENLVDKGVIKRNSIDGDQEICDEILDTLQEQS